jgi:PAS domain S-box-containing protein
MKNSENNKHLGAGAKMSDGGNQSMDNGAISPERTLLRRYGASVSIGLIGLTLSLAAFFFVGEWETKWRKFGFDRLAEARCNSFKNEITHHLHELVALKRFYDGSQFVSREEFVRFVTPILVTDQHVCGFAWAPRVTDTDRNAFEQVLQAEGWAHYLIHDSSVAGEMEVAVHRKEYCPVLYRAPQLDWAIGLDQLSLLPQREAIEQARDMNQVVVTGPTVFPGEPTDRFRVIAFAPVYKKGLPITTVEERRAAIEGVVSCAMGVGDILENVIGELQPGGVDTHVSDLSAPEGEQSLIQYRARLRNQGESDFSRNVENSSEMSFVTSFDVANRTWEMRCMPSSGYLASHPEWIHWILLLGGLILTSLLVVFTYTRQNRMAIVEERVDERTAELRASEQQLKASNQQLIASEQQLKASYQQLMAAEQQLRASNQQLRAGEQQLKAANQQLMASEQQLKATNQQLVASEQQLRVSNYDLSKRVKELNCLYGISHLVESPASSLESIFEGTCDLIKESWQYPDITCVRIIVNGREFKTAGYRTTEWKQLADIELDAMTVGHVEVCYLESMPESDEGPFLKKERNLIEAIAKRAGEIIKWKQTEQALKESEERFRNVAESMADWIWEVDTHGVYTYVSPGIESIMGYTTDEVLGKTPFDFMPREEAERVGLQFQAISRNKEPIRNLENWNLHKDGHRVCLLTNGVPLLDDQGNLLGYLGVDRDITETRRLQALESRAERLETAGTIAGQVAHDFNNLLAPIMAYPEFIHEELPHDHKAHAYLDAIENAAQKMANINQDLLTMGRRGHYNLEVLDLNRVALQAVQEMESRTKTVTFEMKLCKDLMKTKGGGAQIHRMLSNLLVNAQDAMQDIGQITIKTENYYADDTSVAFGRVPKGEYVKLTVSDNGCGIPDDIIQKILDPFFSTKTTDKKRGSGLGLSVVDAVIKDHDGYLDLSSTVGRGTSFYLYFPVTRESTGEEASELLTGGTEKILVVDDDDIQREVSTQLLKKLGYKVSCVESGEKAIEFLGANEQDLVILDMVMPGGIDGAETYRRILEISPHQKAIILSGFSESDRVFEAQELGAGAFVRKPITRESIAAAIRTELDRAGEGGSSSS